MRILNMSNTSKTAEVQLSIDELIKICYALLKMPEEKHDITYCKLYGGLLMVRDVCEYGGVDGFTWSKINELRNKINKEK